jgi:hypothetical protein
MESVFMVVLQVRLDGEEFAVHGGAHAFPAAEDLERHEILAQNGRDEDTVFFGDDFFGGSAFFFDEEGGVAV